MHKMLTKKYIQNIKHGGFRSFVQRALELGVTIDILLDSPRIYRLSHSGKVLFTAQWNIPLMKQLGNTAVDNKVATKVILRANNISTPKGILAHSLKECIEGIQEEKLSYPLICKPLDGSLARGMTWDICSQKKLPRAILTAQKAYKKTSSSAVPFIVEEVVIGDEYRIIVFQNQVLACVKKLPATVTGDGCSTLQELILAFNKTRRHGFEIKVDSVVKETLKRERLTLASVLPDNSVLKLRHNLNMSDGGRAIDCTAQVHPKIRQACVRATQAVGLTFGGLDVITEDITKDKYTILEINSRPYHNMHEKPLVEGESVDISGILLQNLFPKLKK